MLFYLLQVQVHHNAGYELLGTDNVGHFFVILFFAYLGAFVSLLQHSTDRDKSSERTPFQWSFKFLMSDNNKRIVLGVIVLFLAVRFFPDWNGGKELTIYEALLTGLGIDKLLETFRNFCVIDKK